jgi:hypothetical protein
MLAHKTFAVAARPAFVRVSARAYSAHHGKEEHGHHEEEHGHDHGHEELAEAESIVNSKTGIAVGIVATVVAYSYFNSSYKESHDGSAFTSFFTTPTLISDLQDNFTAYRQRVAKQKEIQEMMMFPGEKPRSYNNLITSIDNIPGKYFPSGSNTQFNTIQDHSTLAPRKAKESPFY